MIRGLLAVPTLGGVAGRQALTGSWGVGLARFLAAAGVEMNRQARRKQGKSRPTRSRRPGGAHPDPEGP